MARFVKTFVLVLLMFAASQALKMSGTQARRAKRAESVEGSERTAVEIVVGNTGRNTSYPRDEATGAPRSVDSRLGVNPGAETEHTRAQRTASRAHKAVEGACVRGRCVRGGTGRRPRCPRRRSRPGPPVVHLYMRYLTWRSNWQLVNWRRGMGNFKFKVNCHVSKVNVIRESELHQVLTFSTTFQKAVRRGTLQPPYRLVLLKVVQRSGVRTHRHLTSKTVFGNETAPWVIFNISRLVQTWRSSSRLKHSLRLTVVSMATGLQVGQRITKRLLDTRREATLLAAYVREGERKEDVFPDRSGTEPRQTPRQTWKEGRSRSSLRPLQDRAASLAVLQRVLLGNNTGHDTSGEEKPRGPELLRDWLAYRGRKQSRHNDTGSEGRGRRQVGECHRHDYHGVFDDIILPEFILQPPRFNAYRCGSACTRPFPTHMNATNHAMLMSLLHERTPHEVPAPCCVPLAYSAISVMEQHGDNIVVKPYPNMRVETCGCR
ncbi:bone morphogenetic protein 2-like [Branchiostoma floridae]|uniref:Bone morphogenetic protein 2-like n=2 Tax=Branchiostoma floridae TaxID=7739 RepID=A0A9J7MF51_BRAFL|nr:bone morphogenetic protein 2-like [Branchiostoma floridae]